MVGKWVLVDNRRNRQIQKIKWVELITVFVSNLHENISVDWLRFLFHSLGNRMMPSFLLQSGEGRISVLGSLGLATRRQQHGQWRA